MKPLNATAAILAATLLVPLAATARADSATAPLTPIQGPHQTNAATLWQSQMSAPSGGVHTTRSEATDTTPGRLWTNRAQRGTRTPNGTH